MSQGSPLNNPKMNQEFFTNLPSEIITNILSRLPVRTIMSCKCVCKSLLNLIETPEFAKSHLSKSVQGLAVFLFEMLSAFFKIFEFEDHQLHYHLLTKFKFPHGPILIQGSANGLLLLRAVSTVPHPLYICNPITRQYIELHCPQEFVYTYPQVVTYGFGVSKLSGQYKVVRIFHDYRRDEETRQLLRIPKSECQVFIVGSRLWRRIASGPLLKYSCLDIGAFLNGNLHWLVFEINGSPWISCFDLETELFSTFSTPLPPLPPCRRVLASVSALGDRLCLCDNTSNYEIVIWLMKEYGIEKSWTKEFVISKIPDIRGEFHASVYAIKVFKDGDILMVLDKKFLFYYSSKNKTTQKVDEHDQSVCLRAILHTPSFLSLRSLGMENHQMSELIIELSKRIVVTLCKHFSSLFEPKLSGFSVVRRLV